MRTRLRKVLQDAEGTVSVYSSFDLIGDIAITKVPNQSTVNLQILAEVIMKRHPKVKAVYVQNSKVTGNYRLRNLTHVAGENRAITEHKESGCTFKVDVEKCYFSPRLQGERARIAQLVQPGEVVVNMFAGVGCFSILIAKKQPTAKVYSIDINPDAVQYMQENSRVNRVFGNVVSLLGDAKSIVEAQLTGCADRVLMPLPEKAYEYLPVAVSALKPNGGWIHLHVFEHADKTEDPSRAVRQKVKAALEGGDAPFEVPFSRVVRSTGPNWWQLAADVHVLS